MPETILTGGCGCGHVRYRVHGEPIFVNNCHCRRCQQQTGSTSVVNAFYESERVELLGGALTEHGNGGERRTTCNLPLRTMRHSAVEPLPAPWQVRGGAEGGHAG